MTPEWLFGEAPEPVKRQPPSGQKEKCAQPETRRHLCWQADTLASTLLGAQGKLTWPACPIQYWFAWKHFLATAAIVVSSRPSAVAAPPEVRLSPRNCRSEKPHCPPSGSYPADMLRQASSAASTAAGEMPSLSASLSATGADCKITSCETASPARTRQMAKPRRAERSLCRVAVIARGALASAPIGTHEEIDLDDIKCF
mmetsp:Transcript_132333/g.295950  ORF Transcript_132333/g.295950 Transcript_132333/m.295950 type:complete len:200 (-) Transcript_132333:62-661(-)